MSATERRSGGLLSRVSIRDKFSLALAVVLALFTYSAYNYNILLNDVKRALDRQAQSEEVIVGISKLLVAAINQEDGLRGYLVALTPQFLEPYKEGLVEFESEWRRLREITFDNPVQQVNLDEVRVLMNAWQIEFADRMLDLVRNAPEETLQSQIRVEAAKGNGKRIVDQLRLKLRSMRDVELQQLAERSRLLDRSMDRTRVFSLVMLASGIGFGILVILLISRSISDPISRLTGLMARLSDGDTDIEIPYTQRGDEVGAIARALEVFRVGVGQIAAREWVKTRVTQLSSRLQGCDSHADFASALCAELCEASGGVHAVLYRWDEARQLLESAGGHALPPELAAASFRLGEGLLGQCGADLKPRMLDQIPLGYVTVRSALGQAQPTHIYLLPLKGHDGLAGVVEMALFQPPPPRALEYIEEAGVITALSLETLSRGLRTRLLLEQTERQRERLQASEEELRAQQEELRATNEALGEKTRTLEEQGARLRASEEELRAGAEELRMANQSLKARGDEIERAQAELQQKAQDLEQASRYKSEFLANMSHELRTPLNSLLILSKGLADNDDGNLNEEQVESARIIHESGSNLLTLINDILDLSKIEAGKLGIIREPVNLAAFAGAIERNFRHVAEQRKLGFTISLAPGLPEQIESDGSRMRQIINNLLSNAFKFTHEGAVSLRLEPQGERIALRVRDSGIGIPADKLARIFEAFEQADAGTSRRYGGTGLGLSICRGLAQLLGGELSVESVEGEGSCFTLWLPQTMPASVPATILTPPVPVAAPPPAAAATVAQAGASSLLIIEDDPQFSEVLAGIARRKDYEVLVARDGEEGLALARSHRPDAILLDIGLPGMDGWQVMTALKADPQLRRIPVHFISGDDQTRRALDLGAVGFLVKPVTREAVLGALETVARFRAGGQRRLLLVDADAASRAEVRRLVADTGVDVVEASTAAEALQSLESAVFDGVILDLGLSDLSGLEFLERAARKPNLPPVVVYSARDLSEDETLRLREYTDSIVIRGARSPERLLDEVTLFLHARKPEAPAAPPPRAASPALEGRTALVVDDDMRNIFALSKSLRTRGMKVVMAQDGQKALAQLVSQKDVDVVLMDIMMPGMDGYECIRRIRANPEWTRLPIIAVTAKAMAGDREKCMEAGANDYCAKPIDVDQLAVQMAALMPTR